MLSVQDIMTKKVYTVEFEASAEEPFGVGDPMKPPKVGTL
jgi:hypothetical protein